MKRSSLVDQQISLREFLLLREINRARATSQAITYSSLERKLADGLSRAGVQFEPLNITRYIERALKVMVEAEIVIKMPKQGVRVPLQLTEKGERLLTQCILFIS